MRARRGRVWASLAVGAALAWGASVLRAPGSAGVRIAPEPSVPPVPRPTAQTTAPADAEAPPPARAVVLLTVDAFRADQPWTGYAKVKTPVLSALAERSVVYTRAYALANTTTSSLAGMMSARYPGELVRDDCGFAGYELTDTLAGALSRGGVHTLAAHAHAIFASSFAPTEGFAEWKVVPGVGGKTQESGAVTGDELAGLLVAFLRGVERPERFFVWAHFVDPHDAYAPHPEFPPGPGLRGAYDAEIAYTDRAIGRVLAALEEEGLAETTAVIVTGDHGEAFGEHERLRHGHTLFEEEVRVPLLVRVPGVAARKVEVARSAIDLPKTIAEILGVRPFAAWRGTSLVRDWEAPPEKRTVIVDAPEFANLPAQRAVVIDRTKVTWQRGHLRAVHDLRADPGETRAIDGPIAEPIVRRATLATSGIPFIPPARCRRDGR